MTITDPTLQGHPLKLIFVQLVKKFPTLKDLEYSLSCSQNHVFVSYPETVKFFPHLYTLFL